MQDKVKGALIGLAIGDALGVPHEFRNSKEEYTGLLQIQPKFRFRWTSRTDVVGQYSDDTEMTLCLMRSISENKGYDPEKAALKYMEWANSAKAMGENTRALFKGVKTLNGYLNRYEKRFSGLPQDGWTQSNGSLMRAFPLAFLKDSQAAITDCVLSNPHPVNVDCNRVYCHLIKCLADGYAVPETLRVILGSTLQDAVRTTIVSARDDKTFNRDITENKGWVLHSLYCAIWAICNFERYSDAIDFVINLGGDTDTNAAITGALFGAKLGFTKLQTEPNTAYNTEVVLNLDTTKGDNPRPDYLLLKDIDQLVSDFLAV